MELPFFQNIIIKYFFIKYFSNYKAWNLQHRRRWHYLRYTTWRLHNQIYISLCVCVCVCVRAHVCASQWISGFFWKNKIELHLGLWIKCSKCPPLFRKPNRSLLSKFFNTYLSISGVITNSILFIMFPVVGAFS